MSLFPFLFQLPSNVGIILIHLVTVISSRVVLKLKLVLSKAAAAYEGRHMRALQDCHGQGDGLQN